MTAPVSPSAPVAWRLVPVEPDEAMELAGMHAPFSERRRATTNSLDRQQAIVADIYAAMLAASPAPSLGVREALETARAQFDLLARLSCGSAVYEVDLVSKKRTRRKLSEVIASEADAGSKHCRECLALLAREGV